MADLNGRLRRLEGQQPRASCPTCERWPDFAVRYEDEPAAADGRPLSDPHPRTCPDCGRVRNVIVICYTDTPPAPGSLLAEYHQRQQERAIDVTLHLDRDLTVEERRQQEAESRDVD